MSSPTEHPLFDYLFRHSNAIGCLRENGHIEFTTILLYAAIDTMAWLSFEGEEAGSKQFKSWVEKYMLSQTPNLLSGVSASDLWGARCGIIHTGAPESRELNKGHAQYRVFYATKCEEVISNKSDEIYLSLELLSESFVKGVQIFIDELLASSVMDEVARRKMKRMLSFEPLKEKQNIRLD